MYSYTSTLEKRQMNSIRNKLEAIVPSSKTKLLIGAIMIASIIVIVIVSLELYVWEYDWLNVHLIPHSHDDVGWLHTPEDYYRYSVRYILDHVIIELNRKKIRKFVYSETYFFWKWWQEQSTFVRKLVRDLIHNKQLEIIGGGWCMSDEAVTHYQSFIDQSTWGFRRLNDTFGQITCPTIGWQIDTFGHSKGIASLLAQMGFTSLFFARIDVNERKYRKVNKLMEFVWTGNENSGGSIFTSVFYDHYSAPPGFDFEMLPTQTGINYAAFSSYVHNQAKFFKTNHILVPMGDDFRFFNARKYFLKIDKLISFFDKNSKFRLNVFYSTPSEYVRSLQNLNLKWPHQKNDFFPYATENHGYWTGFYTSRPTLKYFERISNNILQITKQLLVFADIGGNYFDELTSLREAVGVVQHHDAITGTAQQHVTDHYVKLLHDGITDCEIPLNDALGKLSMPDQEYISGPMFESCLLLNISSCPITEKSSRFVVNVYNSLSRMVSHYVRVPVIGDQYSVLTPEGTELQSQLVAIPKSVRRIPGRTSTAKLELVFKVTDIPAMGFKSFYVFRNQRKSNPKKTQKGFSKKNLKPVIDLKSGTIFQIKLKNESYSLSQGIAFYKSSRKWSGAYVFTPEYENTFSPGDEVQTKLLNNGDLVNEYEQTFSDWASQIVRIYKDEDHVEFEWLVGPIPISDFVGKEVILTYQSDIESGSVFYTDVNGMGMEKRTKERTRWKGKIYEEAAGNYYPVTTMISVKDDSSQMFVINDRAQGGSSLRSGQIELMVHRRLCYDDDKGVSEPLDETAYGIGLVARGRHWLLLGNRKSGLERKAKLLAQSKHSHPWLFFLDASSLSFEEWRSKYLTEFSGLNSYLPPDIRVLTLEPWKDDAILLRLEHIFDRVGGSRSVADEPVPVDMTALFKNFEIIEARETSLGADRWLSDMERLNWRTDVRRKTFNRGNDTLPTHNLTVYLEPQEIRTFIIKVKRR